MRKSGSRTAAERGERRCTRWRIRARSCREGRWHNHAEPKPGAHSNPKAQQVQKLSEWLSKPDLWDGLAEVKEGPGLFTPDKANASAGWKRTKGIMLTIWTAINLSILVKILFFYFSTLQKWF